MEPYLFIIILSISIILLIVGIFGRLLSENRLYSTFGIASGVLIMIVSLIVLGAGIESNTGETETTSYNYINTSSLELNNTIKEVTYNYKTNKSIITNSLGLVLLLLSLFIIFISSFDLATSEERKGGDQ